MKTIIIYATHHGTTETVAHLIWSKLDSQSTELVNIKKAKHLDLNDYDVVIIGSSIHAGHNQISIRNFCKKNMPELLEKHLGLFLCCMMEGKEATLNLQNAYPEI
ncbi:MAG: flavodoxin domain-containing protein, partial [Bacteroidales bacterium]